MLEMLESFSRYPHQVTAVKAEVAYYNMDYENAIVRYLYLGEREKAIQTMERMATARLWSVAAPTQVRPMRFFKLPIMHDFLDDEEVFIKEGTYYGRNKWFEVY